MKRSQFICGLPVIGWLNGWKTPRWRKHVPEPIPDPTTDAEQLMRAVRLNR